MYLQYQFHKIIESVGNSKKYDQHLTEVVKFGLVSEKVLKLRKSGLMYR